MLLIKKNSFTSNADGDKIKVPRPPSPPKAFYQINILTSIFYQCYG